MNNKRRTGRSYCCAFGCLNSTRNVPDLTLFTLPKDPERRREWLVLIGREDLLRKENLNPVSYKVCYIHFEAMDIKTIKRLNDNALPTKFLNNDASSNIVPRSFSTIKEEPSTIDDSLRTESKVGILPNVEIKEEETKSIETQTEFSGSSESATQTSTALSENTPQKRKLLKNLKDSEHKRRRLEFEFNKIKQELEAKNAPITSDAEDDATRRFQKLIDWQNKLKNRNKGNRYDAEYKVFALSLHYCSPFTYRCLQTVLKLPSKSTLNRFKFKIPPKLDNRVLDSLALKLKSLPEKAKYCSICVDKMVLKRNLYYDIKMDEVIGFQNIDGKISPEIASNAYVIMLQGIHYNWKQPIAYALLASTKDYVELDTWMNKVIRSLFGIGIEIKAVISDQGSDFDKYAKIIKQVTVEKPYFFIDDRKIYYIFDVPHLLKCVRNNLLSSNFYYEGNLITWDYIKTLYEDQKEKNLRLIPKVTDAHVQPNNFQRLRLKYASQIFSNTVYAALETYIDFGKIPEAARATAQFIKTMDSVFDILNSNKVKSVKKLQIAFRMSQDQKTVLDKAQNMFANIKSVNPITGNDNTNQIRTFLNFQISIQAIQQLFQDLRIEGFHFLFTRRLNQDSLENFFACVRQQCGGCTEPTSRQFTRAFSKLFFTNMLTSSPSTNCETDIYKTLLKAEDIINTNITSPEEEIQPSLVCLVRENDYRMDLPEANAVTYVAGYLIHKCVKKHNCNEMNQALSSVPDLELTKLFTHFRAYNKNASFYGGLRMPPKYVIEYVENIEVAFTSNFEKCIQNRLGSTIFQILNEISPVKICECFPLNYFLKLFVRLRIYATLKFNNLLFKGGKKSIKQYLKVKQL